MARLSAHGSKELARFVREVKDEADGSTHRTTYSVRDDGRVLIKRDGTYLSARYGSAEKERVALRGAWTRARRADGRPIVLEKEEMPKRVHELRVRLLARGFTEERP
jgi:hypothetical protein